MYALTVRPTRAPDRLRAVPGYSRRVQPVAVRILHPAAPSAAGPLERALIAARAANADRLAELFRSAGAADARIETGPPDGVSFGGRLRALVGALSTGAGLVVLGSGAMPLGMRADALALLEVAGSGLRRAVANNVYSADVIAIGAAGNLASVPDLPSDNALPRWLRDMAGYEVTGLPRPRLQLDLDSPLDVVIAEAAQRAHAAALDGIDTSPVRARIHRLRVLANDPHRELVVAGRTSAATLRWLEAGTRSRTRALIEERGLRAIGLTGDQRPPRSVLGLLLDDRGPEAIASVLTELADGAVVDTRVLIAHRLGADEARWPLPEDRFASDLLLPDGISDPWLRALTTSARDASIPILFGGHTLVGPGLRLAIGGGR
jgi:hypothetical protein